MFVMPERVIKGEINLEGNKCSECMLMYVVGKHLENVFLYLKPRIRSDSLIFSKHFKEKTPHITRIK